MFGVGFLEILVIAIACLLVFDPKDFPKIAQKFSRLYQQIANLKEDMRFKISLDDVKRDEEKKHE